MSSWKIVTTEVEPLLTHLRQQNYLVTTILFCNPGLVCFPIAFNTINVSQYLIAQLQNSSDHQADSTEQVEQLLAEKSDLTEQLQQVSYDC